MVLDRDLEQGFIRVTERAAVAAAHTMGFGDAKLSDHVAVEAMRSEMGKRNNVWVARESAKLAREILGANGIVDDYPVIRHMLNIESVYTYEGTHDIHSLVIGQRVTGIAAFEPPPAAQPRAATKVEETV